MASGALTRGVVFSIAIAVIATSLTVVNESAATASSPQQVVRWTKIGIYPHTGPSWSTPRSGPAVPDGTVVTVLCETTGDAITSDATANDTIWADTNIGFIPNAFLDSGYNGRTPGVPDCGSGSGPTPAAPAPSPAPQSGAPAAQAPAQTAPAPTLVNPAPAPPVSSPVVPPAPSPAPPSLGHSAEPNSSFDRSAALASIERHWNDPPKLVYISLFGWNLWSADDCTWFASETLWAGGLAQTEDWAPRSPDPSRRASQTFGAESPTKDAMNATDLETYLVDQTHQAQRTRIADLNAGAIPGAQVGDLIYYVWNPTDPSKRHIAIVQSVGTSRGTLVAQHTDNYSNKPWNKVGNSSQTVLQQNPGMSAYLIHITK